MRMSWRAFGAVSAVAIAAIQVSAESGSYRAPRTPWGDPDLQGNYTNLSEAGTPLERPKEFEGRNMNDVSPQERARLKKESAERTIGRFLGPAEAPDNWWQPAYGKFTESGAQLWFIVDPPDGKIPALTPAARARHNSTWATRAVTGTATRSSSRPPTSANAAST